MDDRKQQLARCAVCRNQWIRGRLSPSGVCSHCLEDERGLRCARCRVQLTVLHAEEHCDNALRHRHGPWWPKPGTELIDVVPPWAREHGLSRDTEHRWHDDRLTDCEDDGPATRIDLTTDEAIVADPLEGTLSERAPLDETQCLRCGWNPKLGGSHECAARVDAQREGRIGVIDGESLYAQERRALADKVAEHEGRFAPSPCGACKPGQVCDRPAHLCSRSMDRQDGFSRCPHGEPVDACTMCQRAQRFDQARTEHGEQP